MSAPFPPLPKLPQNDPEVTSFRALHARHTLRKHLDGLAPEVTRDLPPLVASAPPDDQPIIPGSSALCADTRIQVGIIGAGAAGLYAGMILEIFADKFSYEILEANPRRVGGRLYTHKFPDGQPNDYYDVGAMRFPYIRFMRRTFDLFHRLGIEPIPYVLALPQNLNLFNGKVLTNAEIEGRVDPFGTHVPGVNDSSSAMVNVQIGGFKDQLARNFAAGWEELMKFDEYSTRAYMLFQGSNGVTYSNRVIDYLETFGSASNLYDQALTETVMDSMDFDYPHEPGTEIQWYCIQGGAEQIAERMKSKLTGEPVLPGKRVTALSLDDTKAPTAVQVAVAGEDNLRTYQHVITTLPFGCLRTVDTSACAFSWELQEALRMLHYDASTKVAIQFSSRWWEEKALNQLGGVSSTDRPTRVVVYPSYGMGQTTGATMIVSYTWSQDALRLGALVRGHDNSAEAILIDLILNDLAAIHSVDKSMLESLMVDYHAFNWYDDEFSAGAFALFGPGQFATLYPKVTRPWHGRIHFAGEATSVHHAWLVGSLNSAYRAVKEILVQYDDENHTLVQKLEENFEKLDEIDDESLKLQVRLGRHRSGIPANA